MYGKYKRRTAGFRGPGESQVSIAIQLVEQGCSQSETARRSEGRAGKASASGCDDTCVTAKPGCARPMPSRLEADFVRRADRTLSWSLLLEGPEAHELPDAAVELSAGRSSDRRRIRACAISNTMSGRSIERSVGAPATATVGQRAVAHPERKYAAGSARLGRPLKKSPQRKTYDRLHRRKRIESEAASLPHLGVRAARHRCWSSRSTGTSCPCRPG